MKHIPYPSIDQFRSVAKNISLRYAHTGKDAEGKPMYNHTIPKPTITFNGTVKLHGTNAAVCLGVDGYWAQSRKNIITPQKDNAGFAFFAETKKECFYKLFQKLGISDYQTLTIFGEWVGKGIQKGVAISEMEKSFFIIGAKYTANGEDFNWLDTSELRDKENRIYNINDYKKFSVTVDFNHPELSQNEIIEQTISVEDECPVSKEFGIIGVGEGIVYTCGFDGNMYWFKSKGEKHQKSHVKTLKPVDNDAIAKRLEMAEKVTPEWRLEQFLTDVCDLNNSGEITRTKMADFIRAVINDVLKEDLDLLAEAGIEPKEINKYISDICRKYFFEREKLN